MPASAVLLLRVVLLRETMPGVLKVLMWPGPPDQVISKPARATSSSACSALNAATAPLYAFQSWVLPLLMRLVS